MEFLSDLRFLSIDFLNTILLTYRVFTDGETVLNALKKVFYDAQPNGNRTVSGEQLIGEHLNIPGKHDDETLSPRRTSGASSVSGEYFISNFECESSCFHFFHAYYMLL